MHIIAIANQKGGVGKTATTHTLGVLLAEAGRRVLLVDADPQSSLTAAAIGYYDGPNLADVLGGSTPGRVKLAGIIQQVNQGLDLAPAGIELAGVELGLVSRMGRETQLTKALAGIDYDYCLIDCPPSLGLLTVNALVAADQVLIPTQPQAADVRGVGLFLKTIDQIKDELNPGLQLLGVLVTFYDTRINHHQAAIDTMTGAGLPVLNTKIGRSVKVAEAAGNQQTVITYEPHNPQAEAYRDLAKELKLI